MFSMVSLACVSADLQFSSSFLPSPSFSTVLVSPQHNTNIGAEGYSPPHKGTNIGDLLRLGRHVGVHARDGGLDLAAVEAVGVQRVRLEDVLIARERDGAVAAAGRLALGVGGRGGRGGQGEGGCELHCGGYWLWGAGWLW